ncbi:MAG: hypothetical protein K2L02_04680 [Clostridia bacterium]|nr:hypothetical protein [Clostridia bacterium]
MKKESIKNFFNNKTARTVLILLIALLLVFAVYRVFFKSEEKPSNAYEATELEERLSKILSKIDGVGDTSVMVSEEEGKAVSAVIVFRGADSILTRMRVIDAASGALGIDRANVLVYPAES